MKLKLLKDHEHYGIKYKEGDEIEVTQQEYEFLINAYIADRKEVVTQAKEVEVKLESAKKTKVRK